MKERLTKCALLASSSHCCEVKAGSLYGSWGDGGNALACSEAEGSDDGDHDETVDLVVGVFAGMWNTICLDAIV